MLIDSNQFEDLEMVSYEENNPVATIVPQTV